MTKPAVRVLKLGGSLLEMPDFAGHLQGWLSRESSPQVPSVNCLLVGGGLPVDAIRELARQNEYDQISLHWLCVDAMDISYRLVSLKLPGWNRVGTPESLQWFLSNARSKASDASAIIHTRAFYRADNEAELPVRLPLSWDTTSDSLAALLAVLVSADELVLFKSCHVPAKETFVPSELVALADQGIVDRELPNLASRLPRIRFVQLNQQRS
ncbi:MAG: hypothetical protein IT423_07805 [Pirellulaceae bacterium]|nr:hypothetical protein [Pirellulaceae bacterium]